MMQQHAPPYRPGRLGSALCTCCAGHTAARLSTRSRTPDGDDELEPRSTVLETCDWHNGLPNTFGRGGHEHLRHGPFFFTFISQINLFTSLAHMGLDPDLIPSLCPPSGRSTGNVGNLSPWVWRPQAKVCSAMCYESRDIPIWDGGVVFG